MMRYNIVDQSFDGSLYEMQFGGKKTALISCGPPARLADKGDPCTHEHMRTIARGDMQRVAFRLETPNSVVLAGASTDTIFVFKLFVPFYIWKKVIAILFS